MSLYHRAKYWAEAAFRSGNVAPWSLAREKVEAERFAIDVSRFGEDYFDTYVRHFEEARQINPAIGQIYMGEPFSDGLHPYVFWFWKLEREEGAEFLQQYKNAMFDAKNTLSNSFLDWNIKTGKLEFSSSADRLLRLAIAAKDGSGGYFRRYKEAYGYIFGEAGGHYYVPAGKVTLESGDVISVGPDGAWGETERAEVFAERVASNPKGLIYLDHYKRIYKLTIDTLSRSLVPIFANIHKLAMRSQGWGPPTPEESAAFRQARKNMEQADLIADREATELTD